MTPAEQVQALTGRRMCPVQARRMCPVQARRHLEQREALLAQIEQERRAAVARCLENFARKDAK